MDRNAGILSRATVYHPRISRQLSPYVQSSAYGAACRVESDRRRRL